VNRKLIYLAFPILVFLLLFVSSFTPVVTRGEGREGLIVKALSWGESFILPLRHGEEIPSKPPLFHWVGYGLSKVTGHVGPMEIRAGSALGTALLIVGTYLFFSLHSGALIGLLTTSILASSLEVMRYSTQARVDPLFAGVFSSAVYFIFSFYVGKGSRVVTGLGSLFFLVLSVLAKGPFGLILPVGVLVIYLLFRFEQPDFKTLTKGFLIFLVALGLSSIWYVLAYKVGGDKFLEVQLLKENAYRVVKAEGDERGHEKPFYFTFLYLILASIPWCFFLPRIASGFNALKREAEFKSNKILLFSVSWVSLFVLAVMVSVSKRSVYFLPALPALSFIITLCMIEAQKLVLRGWIVKYEKLLGLVLNLAISVLIIAFLVILSLPMYQPFLEAFVANESFLRMLRVISVLKDYVCLIYLVGLVMAHKYFTRAFARLRDARVEDAIREISLSLIMLFFVTQVLIASRVMGIESPEEFMVKAETLLPSNQDSGVTDSQDIVQYKNEYYAPAFYLDRPVPVIGGIMELNKCASKFCVQRETYLFLEESDLSDFNKIPYEVLLLSTEKLANRDQKLVLIKLGNRRSQ